MGKFFCMDEWHSFVLGWCEVMCYLKERIPLKSEDILEMVNRERWYYTFGRAMGTFTWVGIIIAIVRSIAV